MAVRDGGGAPGAGGANGGSLWDSDLIGGVAFRPRKCQRSKGRHPSSGVGGWVDSDYRVGDGTRIAYRLYISSAPATGGEKPCILVYFHANAELCTDIEGDVNMFYRCGYTAILCPEFRGYAWSGGKPRLSILGPDADAVMEALPEILTSAGIEGAEDAVVVVLGRSLGSICAVHVASSGSSPCQIGALVVESGVVSLLDLPMVRQLGGMMPEVLMMLKAEPDPIGSLAKLRQVSVPTLIIHGDQDEISPVSQAIQAHAACGSTAKRILRLWNCHHNDVRAVAGRAYYEALKGTYKVAVGETLAEDLLKPSARGGLFDMVSGVLSCFPGMRRCLSGTQDTEAPATVSEG